MQKIDVMRWTGLCVFIVTLVLPVLANSASQKKSDLNGLILKSDAVVYAKCTNIRAEWRKNKIYSIASMRVEDTLKGTLPSLIYVEYMGGTAIHPKLNSPVTMNVSNGISFKLGDEAVLMLDKISNEVFRVNGASQGILPIAIDQSSGKKIIQSGARKLQSAPSKKDGSVILSGRPMDLTEFKEFVRTRMANEKKRAIQ